ncbi:MAG: diaminopimelate decarboxylase [Desertifilum sp. SIO1I2]|nr:diaminopimelate decarboxylase [Desertifilum sp. SIO1I2]
MVSTHSRHLEQSGRQYLPQPSPDGGERSPNQELLPLSTQVNQQDGLEIGGCDVTELVKTYGSPLYILDELTLRTACRQYREAMHAYYSGESQVIYASKAWNCLAICAIVASEGLGVDVASGGELYTALKAGVSPDRIYFHGNNKSFAELKMAVEVGCQIVVDNYLELQTLTQLGEGAAAPVSILLRVTPGIECHTHDYIRTGQIDSKFGFDPNQLETVFRWIADHECLNCMGLHAHIGSQIFELNPHRDLANVMLDWTRKASEVGLSITHINVGGGLGIRYTESDDPPSITEWVKQVAEAVTTAWNAAQLPLPKLLCEPGRSIVGPACVTAYTLGSRKEVPGLRTYLAVDGGMSDNARPITYQSVYRAVVANRMSAPPTQTATIAGKHCESGDILIQSAQLPATEPGDILVVMGTGAYNYSMASNYNRLTRSAAVLVNSQTAELIVQRETYEDLIRCDRLPSRIAPTL